MAEARYRLRSNDPDFGRICPRCASPKAKQARRCAACYRDDQLAGRVRTGGPRRAAPRSKRQAGGPTGRPQPQTHPWRAKNALLFRKRAA